jgi:uncharacterized protein YlxW (UPF0749 family)
MAKRSQYCQKIIKKLNEKIQTLENNINERQSSERQTDNQQMNEDLISFLEQKLEETMNRMAQL